METGGKYKHKMATEAPEMDKKRKKDGKILYI
jgi:hypothetical protein